MPTPGTSATCSQHLFLWLPSTTPKLSCPTAYKWDGARVPRYSARHRKRRGTLLSPYSPRISHPMRSKTLCFNPSPPTGHHPVFHSPSSKCTSTTSLRPQIGCNEPPSPKFPGRCCMVFMQFSLRRQSQNIVARTQSPKENCKKVKARGCL